MNVYYLCYDSQWNEDIKIPAFEQHYWWINKKPRIAFSGKMIVQIKESLYNWTNSWHDFNQGFMN